MKLLKVSDHIYNRILPWWLLHFKGLPYFLSYFLVKKLDKFVCKNNRIKVSWKSSRSGTLKMFI